MPTALFLSPHLDDVAFSCSGTLLHLKKQNWDLTLVTVFTRSMPNPQGFALRCQTDKGLAPEVDYMALRRAEDAEFARIVGVDAPQYWEFAEAPHRGYNSPPELFAGVREGDEIWLSIALQLKTLGDFDCVFAPQGLGNHVDHLHVIRAVLENGWDEKTLWYQDTPYVIREPAALPSPLLPSGLPEVARSFSAPELATKIQGCCAYESQIGFQFGGPDEVGRKLTELHRATAQRHHQPDFAEAFLTSYTPDSFLP
jgi:LmbE family N-acetylglucosaminyl deacetylase